MRNHYQLFKKKFLDDMEYCIKVHEAFKSPERMRMYMDVNNLVPDALYSGQYATNFVLAYYMDGSPYYHNDQMLIYAYEALCSYENMLHEDGSADLACTNFHDPAQTGFQTQVLFPVVKVLEKYTRHTAPEDKLFDKYIALMRKTGHAMATLGFHTPNHRWVISSALSVIYYFTKDALVKETLDKLLSEGIDCDEYGEYTERSTGSYNCICNHSFLIWAEFSGDDSFYDYPRRNLNLMSHFIEPDDSVNTLNSTRWDMGGAYSIAKYYPYYLILMLRDENPEFGYFVDRYYDEYINKNRQHFYYLLVYHMLHPETESVYEKITPCEPKKDQTIFLPNSRIARIYKPELNATITALCARHPVFCQINFGKSILQLRSAAAFFGDPHSPFRAREIVPIEDGFRLISFEEAGYRSTFDEKPETSNWRKMDHSKRKMINVQTLRREIDIHVLEDGIKLDIRANGCERVPTKLEIIVPAQGKLITDNIFMVPKEGDYAYLTKGCAKYFITGNDYFEIENGFNRHTFGEQMRGSFPADAKNFTLALTEFTPQESSVTIRMKKFF